MRTQTFLISLAMTSLATLSLMGTTTGKASAQANTNPPQDTRPIHGAALPPPDGQHLFNDTFTHVNTIKALPPSVLRELLGTKEKAEQETGGLAASAKIADHLIRDGMADPGQPFQITDVVGSHLLPFRRLVFAGVSTGYCFVYNEYGGIASGTEVSLYRLPPPPLPERAAPGPPLPADQTAPGWATLVWQASIRDSKTFLTWDQLRQAIRQGQYYTIYSPPMPPDPILAK